MCVPIHQLLQDTNVYKNFQSTKWLGSDAVLQAIKKEYSTAESVKQLSVEFEKEGDALTLDNVSVQGTTASEGWHVATQWDPARVRHLYLIVF